MSYKHIYIAATGQHVGKTTSTLGIAAYFLNKGYKIGYCKPVGQQFLDLGSLRVDKDAILFADLIDFELEPDIHSPIILGRGATAAYLDNPDKYDLPGRIRHAANVLGEQNQFVIFEGTGHPGVGSIADVSNAEVAKLIGAGVIMIVPGGIGNTIDKLNLSCALFREAGVPILGVIVNKVRVDKIDKVKHYLQIKLRQMDLPLLGVIPYEQTLANPIMSTINNAVDGQILHNADRLDNWIEDIVAGSLLGLKELKTFRNLLLVVAANKVDSAIHKIESIANWMDAEHSPLSGIVATGTGKLSDESLQYIRKYRIPYILTKLDTYGSVLKISRIEVKINQNTPWKVSRAIELIKQNVQLDSIIEQMV